MNRFHAAAIAAFLAFSPAFAAPGADAAASRAQRQPEVRFDEDGTTSLLRFLSAVALIRNYYVDSERATYSKLFEAALDGMLQSLDPFTAYETPDDFASIQEDTSGKFAGIGAVLNKAEGTISIEDVVSGGPAQQAGLRKGDKVIRIEKDDVRSLSMDDCVSRIRGAAGTAVVLTVLRENQKDPLEIRIVRGIVELPTVTGVHYLKDQDRIGYFRMRQFGAETAGDLDRALEKLKDAKALIIDLRSDPGGLLSVAVEVCSRFLETGAPVVSVEGRYPEKNESFASIPCRKRLDLPLILLVDENTASAAEIFAACMQDHRRALVLGEKTFGKGSVQTLIPLKNGGALRLTTAKYYTPSRRVIHEKGIEPDVKASIPNADRRKLGAQLTSSPGEILPDAPGAVRDVQLERATEILRGLERLNHSSANQ